MDYKKLTLKERLWIVRRTRFEDLGIGFGLGLALSLVLYALSKVP